MRSLISSRRFRPFVIIGLLLTFGGVILALFWYIVSPLNVSLFSSPAPIQEYNWSYVEIAKPQRISMPVLHSIGTVIPQSPSNVEEPTLDPIPTDTLAPIPSVTETPGEITMEILENTPAPGHVTSPQPAYAANIPSNTYAGSKYILVDISEQHMYVYDADTLIYSFVASTGINNATRVGTFAVQSKIPNAYGATWNIWMPNWLGIYWAGSLENGIHALPILSNGATLWEGYLGRPVSYGCVVLGTYESGLLYDWAEIGTTVEIQW